MSRYKTHFPTTDGAPACGETSFLATCEDLCGRCLKVVAADIERLVRAIDKLSTLRGFSELCETDQEIRAVVERVETWKTTREAP